MSSDIYRKTRAFPVLYILLLGCSNLSTGPTDAFVSISELRSAPDKLEKRGYHLRMNAELWRDFEPGPTPSDERFLTISITVTDTRRRPIESLEVVYVWVVQGTKVSWPLFEIEKGQGPDHEIRVTARYGPPWACDSRGYVVAGVSISGNKLDLIKSPSRRIICLI